MGCVEIQETHFFQEFFDGHAYYVRIYCACRKKLELAVVTGFDKTNNYVQIKFANHFNLIPGGFAQVSFDWATEVTSSCETCALLYRIKSIPNDRGLVVEEYRPDTGEVSNV